MGHFKHVHRLLSPHAWGGGLVSSTLDSPSNGLKHMEDQQEPISLPASLEMMSVGHLKRLRLPPRTPAGGHRARADEHGDCLGPWSANRG